MDKWKKGVDAKGLMIPGSHTFDDFVSDMQKAQNDYENSIRATGHTIEHVNVRDHLVMDGDHQGEWVDDNHNKAVVKDAMPKMTDTEVHEPEPKLPKEAVAKLQEGKKTRFNNGQWWTLVNGKPTQLQGQ
jgi:hypothetical protein